MINYKLVILLEKVLGSGKPTSGTNFAFFSPFCSHYKQKLEINLETLDGKNPWHCWISNEKGKTIYSLFKKLNVDKHLFDELNSNSQVKWIRWLHSQTHKANMHPPSRNEAMTEFENQYYDRTDYAIISKSGDYAPFIGLILTSFSASCFYISDLNTLGTLESLKELDIERNPVNLFYKVHKEILI